MMMMMMIQTVCDIKKNANTGDSSLALWERVVMLDVVYSVSQA